MKPEDRPLRGFAIDDPTDDNTYLVCMRLDAGGFDCLPGNIISRCSKCSTGIYHRPNPPFHAIKICTRCMLPFAKEAAGRARRRKLH